MVFFNITTDKRHETRHIRRSHRRTALFAVTTGYGRSDFPAVRRDFRLQFQIVRRSPRGEFTHERTCRVSRAQFNRTHTVDFACRFLVARIVLHLCQRRACVHCNGYRRDRIVDFAEVHTDNTRHVVVNDDTRRAHRHSNLYFLLEGSVTTLYYGDSVQAVAVRVLE